MAELLISFCATRPKGLCLGRFDFQTNQFEWVEFDWSGCDIEGAQGICSLPDGYAVLLQDVREGTRYTALALFDKELKLTRTVPLWGVLDPHSVLATSDGFVLVSSGTNQLIRVRLRGDEPPQEEVLWSAADSSEDHLHMNSVCIVDGELYVSMFGPKVALDWVDASGWENPRSGQIWNVSRGQMVCEGLNHPHTLFESDGKICVLESKSGRVLEVRPNGALRELWNLEGYVRGAAIQNGILYVASSAFRKKSKSTGAIRAVPDNASGRCLIYRLDGETGEVECRDLTPFGIEIYDLFALPLDPDRKFASREQAMATRLAGYDQETLLPPIEFEENLRMRLVYDFELHRLINEDADFATGARLLERMIEKAPEIADWHYHLAICLLQLERDYDRAIYHLQRATECGFSEFWVQYNLVAACIRTADFTGAEFHLRRAIEIKPPDADVDTLAQMLDEARSACAP